MNDNFRNFRIKMIFLAICILILLAIKGHIKLGYMPELENRSIAVAFDYYGSFENEVEVLVSCLEEAYMEISGVRSVHSVSESGKGYIVCLFSDKTNLDEAYVQISDVTAYEWSGFPEQVNRPIITKSSKDTYPVFISFFPLENSSVADRIKEAYEAVQGAGEVQMSGQNKMELVVDLHAGRLAGMELSTEVVNSRVRKSNLVRKVAIPSGQTMVLDSRLSSPAEFGKVYMAPDLKLSDVAELDYRETASHSIGHINGQPALIFFVMKSGEGNTVRLCRQLDAVTTHFGGTCFFSLGNKIEKSFIGSSSILLLLLISLVLGLWLKTQCYCLVMQVIFRSIFSVLVAIDAVTLTGFQVDMTVMTAMSLVIIFSFKSGNTLGNNYALNQYPGPITAQDIATLRSIGRKSINDFTDEDVHKAEKWAYKFWQQLGAKSPFFRRHFGDWRENDTSKIEPISEITVLDIKTQKDVAPYIKKKVKDGSFYRGEDKINAETGFNINIGMKVYDDNITYANRDYLRTKDFDELLARVSILQNVEELVEKSVLFDTIVIDDIEKTDRSFVHKFYSLIKVGNKDYIVKLTVDEINPDGNEILRAYNVENIKITPVAVPRFSNPAYTTGAGGSSASIITVADLHALVKQYDKDFHPRPYHCKNSFPIPLCFILLTFIISLYTPIGFRNLVLPFFIAQTAGLCASAGGRYFFKEILMPRFRIPLWCFSPLLLFALVLAPFSQLSPFASDLTFSLEYESGTSFSFIQKSALDIETALMDWNAFERLTLHIDQGRASFTIVGGRKSDIMTKIDELSSHYPEIFFYIPEKHTKHAVDVTVYGNDVTEIKNNILQLAKYVNNSADNVKIIYNFKADMTNIVLEIPVKCVSSGLYPYDVYNTLYYTVSEPVVDKFFAGDVETDVKIRGEVRYRNNLSSLLEIPVLTPFGRAGETGDYINVRKESAQGRIYHRNRMRCLSFSVTGLSRTKLHALVASFPFSGNCHGEVL